MKRYFLLSCIVLMSVITFAQRRHVRPDWLIEKPQAGNKTYEYVVEHGVGLTESAALEEAVTHVHEYYVRRLGGRIESSQSGITRQTERYSIPIKKVCEYTEKQDDNTFCVYVLFQVAVRGNIIPQFDEYTKCNSISKYREFIKKKNAAALAASVFVPGLGQMTKRHFGEGIGTFFGEAALIGGGVAMLQLAKPQKTIMDDISGNVDYDTFMAAKNKYNAYRYTSYGLFGAAAVLYGVNLWRAWACEYKFKDTAFYPTVIPDASSLGYAMGVGVNVTF